MDIVLFGIQGSGKGTQSKFLTERYGLTYFETGSMLRRLATEDSELGKKVKTIIEAGHLVPTEVVMEIVADFLKKLPAGASALFDGIPRKKDQAEAFEAVLNAAHRAWTGVYIDLSKEEAMRRLLSRRICEKCKTVYASGGTSAIGAADATNSTNAADVVCERCGGKLITRSDDNPEAIGNRLNAFFNETLPVIEMYRAHDKIIAVDGTPPIADVTKMLFEKLDPLYKNV